MKKIGVITDSHSGITQKEAAELDILVLPMPFYFDDICYYEDVNLSREAFFQKLDSGSEVSTSQPSPAEVMKLWDKGMETCEQILYIPISSGLSGSCQTAAMLAQDYDGKVHVVNNQRISVTQKQSTFDAMELAKEGKRGSEIKEILEEDKFNSSIYIMIDTLYYLKKGGRITPAAAALGTLLRLKPVLQIQGEKLDAFAKARTVTQAKSMMINAIRSDIEKRFGGLTPDNQIYLALAHTQNEEAVQVFRQEVQAQFPDYPIVAVDPLSLSVSCHIGPGALAVTCCKKLR